MLSQLLSVCLDAMYFQSNCKSHFSSCDWYLLLPCCFCGHQSKVSDRAVDGNGVGEFSLLISDPLLACWSCSLIRLRKFVGVCFHSSSVFGAILERFVEPTCYCNATALVIRDDMWYSRISLTIESGKRKEQQHARRYLITSKFWICHAATYGILVQYLRY